MAESIKKMDSIINSLVSWFTDYPRHLLTKRQKERIINLLERLKNAEPIPEEELKNYTSREYKRIVRAGLDEILKNPKRLEKKIKSKLNLFICDGCKKEIQLIHKEAHFRNCKMWNNIHKKIDLKVDLPESSKPTSGTNDLPGRTYESTGNDLRDQNRSERKLDGSRDTYQYKDENGRFHSSPSEDDYGEDSHA